MKNRKAFFLLFFLGVIVQFSFAQNQLEEQPWHNKSREIHYTPEGNGFVLNHGTRKFNRALYGTNTGFRVEAGDLPEFSMYLPGMGGNFKLGITDNSNSKWLTEADSIRTKYIPGTVKYTIKDDLLKDGSLQIQILALAKTEGFVLKVSGENIPENISLVWLYGGASGKKFSRNGDIGGDPESVFYLKPKYCINNKYTLQENSFSLSFGSENNKKKTGNNRVMNGIFPNSEIQFGNAYHLKSPESILKSEVDSLPILIGKIETIPEDGIFWLLQNTDDIKDNSQSYLKYQFKNALALTQLQASRVEVKTPDPYINTLGGALAMAGDAIWQNPAYLHGSVAWRMHLNAWRGAYVADPLGWHDRAKTHFKSYGNSQVLEPATGPVVPDVSRGLARQVEEIGGTMFSRGYISRHPNRNNVAHHYDMNLIFIDQLIRHFKWTGDIDFLKEMWPVIERHLEWEKRNFDVDGDGLYDAYAAIWASDGLQYSGGGVTYTSGYNYYANKMAAKLATIIGKDSLAYEKEAAKIHEAIQQNLWLSEKGVFAEFKDLLGNQLTHDTPGIWTVYHAMDKEIANPFQAYGMLNYVDTEIPHIPVSANGLEKDDLEVISTTNWQPYTWSVNNVALAEIAHTALAYWQGNQPEKAYKLWESVLVESMYLGASPGGFEQLLFYDAIRGELYRDFADPVGMTARTLVEGLFGIQPDALENRLTIKHGLPQEWNHASLKVPDVSFSFKRNGLVDSYKIKPSFTTKMNLHFVVNAQHEKVKNITVNNAEVSWKLDETVVGKPQIFIDVPYADTYNIKIEWDGKLLEEPSILKPLLKGDMFELNTVKAAVLEVKDASSIFENHKIESNKITGSLLDNPAKHLFVKLKQGDMIWWYPVSINVLPKFEITSTKVVGEELKINFKNRQKETSKVSLTINGFSSDLNSDAINIPLRFLVSGTNQLILKENSGKESTLTFINWDIPMAKKSKWKKVSLDTSFNSKVTDIFENEYLSPRANSATLQLPTQGIGNWCYPYIKPEIDDAGLRNLAQNSDEIKLSQGVPFSTPSEIVENNISFVSQWDNYPNDLTIPLSGKASHAYFMMAGSTNHMQSRMVNGEIIVHYTDGSSKILEMKNPENWWPIEQDYFIDGYAFNTDAPKPPRVHLKTGIITRDFTDYKKIKGFNDFGIDGGAATILDLPLDKNKTLKNVEIKAIANEVVIGLMSMTLLKK